jgi:M6 family metalloprotease-like protein
MKRFLALITLMITILFSFSSCSSLFDILPEILGYIGVGDTGVDIPDDGDGVYDVDFTKATNVKDVTDQGCYLDGCPTVGSPGVLVIPVDFSDATAKSKGYNISSIKNAFEKGGKCDYYSVYDYYYISSYGKLTLDVTVLDFWFRPKHPSTYYENYTEGNFLDEMAMGDQLVMDEALAYLEDRMDLSKFDSDKNGIIDSIVLITTLDISEDDFHWAYRYWNYYTDDYDNYYKYDGVNANDYLWASYEFLYEDENDKFTDLRAKNTFTYIHEFGHILGADDYYDTAGIDDPMGGCDIMDDMTGDHNAFTKFNFGWLTNSRLVTTESSITLTLDSFTKSGDSIILANTWDDALGAYQEYYIVVYYRKTGLNGTVNGTEYGYFSRDGIVVYHVNASLIKDSYDGEVFYDLAYNNTNYIDDYGTLNNLIEYVKSEDDTYTYVVGDSLPTVTNDRGRVLEYTFTVDALNSEYATITFTKN